MRKIFSPLPLLVIALAFVAGCQKSVDTNDGFRSADLKTTNVTGTTLTREASTDGTNGTGAGAAEKKGEIIATDALCWQDELDGFAADVKDLENFGGDSVASEIDRELDGF